jgi:hypothetical protein
VVEYWSNVYSIKKVQKINTKRRVTDGKQSYHLRQIQLTLHKQSQVGVPLVTYKK